jgi:hypothetical protein
MQMSRMMEQIWWNFNMDILHHHLLVQQREELTGWMLTLKKDEASSIQKNTITLVFRWIHQLAVSRMGACSLWTRLKKIAQVSMKDGCSLWLE